MNRVFYKRIIRELCCNFWRYLALFLMIAFGMYIIISVLGAAETIITGTEQAERQTMPEDGQFTTFLPLAEEQEAAIADRGVILERSFYFDIRMPDGSVLRAYKLRQKTDLAVVDAGRLPVQENEVFLEKRYCAEHKISVGSHVEIQGTVFTVTGIGSVPDYDLPVAKLSNPAANSFLFGIAFFPDEQYGMLEEKGHSVEYCYTYRLDGRLSHDGLKELIQGFEFEPDNVLISFVRAEDNCRLRAAAGDMRMNKNVGLFAGVIVMALFAYVISVFVVHRIQREAAVIGTFYALGVRKREIISQYIGLPVMVSLLGSLSGTLAGFGRFGLPLQMTSTYSYFSVPEFEPVYPLYLILYAVIMPPVVSAAVNFFVINGKLSGTALSLMRNGQRSGGGGPALKKAGFLRRFQIRQMWREKRAGITVIAGMLVSLLLFMMGLDCAVLCRNVKNDSTETTRFAYMYTLKVPSEDVPENAEACYVELLSKTYYGYTMDVSVIGIGSGNPYYGIVPEQGENRVVAGASVAQKYGLKKGSRLILTDRENDTDYVFTITEIADYAAGLAVFMEIDSMRELFGRNDGYYNMLLSDTALTIDSRQVNSVTTKEDIVRSSSVFIGLMRPMVVMLTGASVIVFLAVLFLMLNVMIERASFGISLIKIFGYRTKEIKKLYLGGITITVLIGALIAIPASKLAIDRLFPWLIANTSCGMNLEFPPYLYAVIFLGVMAGCFAVNRILTCKLERISPAEVLKNRE